MTLILSDRWASFNPRARDGREKGNDFMALIEKVSIHAPVMDAKWN